MSQRIHRRSDQGRTPLDARWSLQRLAPGEALPGGAGTWMPIPGPDTVAATLRALGLWSLDAAAQNFDADDWWFRAEFDAPAPAAPGASTALEFGGLAGLCEATLNGVALLASSNMHLRHRCREPALRSTGNELLLRFASLDRWLAVRRPRPRWRAPMVANQQLRWARVSLLGRTPGWSPPAAAVGPWRSVDWVQTRQIEVLRLGLRATPDGDRGLLKLDIDLAPLATGATIERVQLQVERHGAVFSADLEVSQASDTLADAAHQRNDAAGRAARHYAGTAVVSGVTLWWPHTHGEPALYDVRLAVHLRGSAEPVAIQVGRIGFRTLTLDTANDGFALHVNGVPVFCRGACWTPLDVVGLKHTAAACVAALEQVREAGMNMLRVSGSMVYEDDAFHDACDALGILVWQDFMFANMDYPAADATFAASVREEATQQLDRWQGRPSLAVLCGNSEAEQQAAMWGSARETWAQPLFDRDLAELADAVCPGVPYWPSSAHGGAFPHQNNAGTTSYYGVGAYLRPPEDARRSGLRFATECLAFANVPPPATIARMRGGDALRVHQSAWKLRTPRDLGAGWDFEDVRDHYLQVLYRIDAAALRREDHPRYLALSRALAAELMATAFGEWRRAGSSCQGALVWFLRDLWAGAGWGVLDDAGLPKAGFHGLRRALAPLTLFFSDEGTNGLDLHLVNDPGCAFAATVRVAAYRDDGLALHQATQAHTIAAHGALCLPLAGWFDEFVDLSRAYRFGPAEHAVVVATLLDATGVERAQAFHFPEGLPVRRERDIGLAACARRLPDGSAEVTLKTRGFAQSIHFDVPGFVARDEYFHLAPGGRRTVRLVPLAADSCVAPRGSAIALNAHSAASLEFE